MERTRDEVVRLLHERGEASVAELAEAIGVSSGSIRRHMDIMVAEQLLKSRLERQPRGRPVTRYSLSEAGEEQSASDNYSRLLDRLYPALSGLSADQVSGYDGEALLGRVFEQVADQVAREHAPQITARRLDERLAQVASALHDEGIVDELEDTGDDFRLRNVACPYRSTAEGTHAACEADRRTIELLVGVPVEQVMTVVAGDSCCEYLIRKDDSPVLAGS